MKCTECGRDFLPDSDEEEICPACQVEGVPEAHQVRQQEPICAAQESPGPQTLEEARQFHEGFLAGATAYAAAVGHSTLKSSNLTLAALFDKQGWATIETYEKVHKPDWRVGLSCKPKLRTHDLYYERGKIAQVHPSGFGNIHDSNGVLMIQMDSGLVFLDKAESWVTA